MSSKNALNEQVVPDFEEILVCQGSKHINVLSFVVLL